MLIPNSATLETTETVVYMGGAASFGAVTMPRIELPDGRMIKGPHREWALHELRWRWLLDSWEGGEVYRQAIYGVDPRGMPIRNMVRHKREYPSPADCTGGYSIITGRPPGTDQAAQATDDDYEWRRAMTPVPTFVAECLDAHLSKIYGREVRRSPVPAGSELAAWLEDVDGLGTSMDLFMSETIAPLLMVLGQLDLVVEFPPAPRDREVRSRADEMELELDVPRASYVLPENMLWWRLGRDMEYEECLVREVMDGGAVFYRYWSEEEWVLFDGKGDQVGPPQEHSYGIVPIVRVFDRRRPRCKNIGLPRYEPIAEHQRSYYNLDSENYLANSIQAHPLIQAPISLLKPDQEVQVGPSNILPMAEVRTGTSVTYQGFEVIDFPKGAAESIRQDKQGIRDAVDRSACLTKPAGAAGTDGNTVSQSGVSKQLDAVGGNELLGKIAGALERCEDRLLQLYAAVTGTELPKPEQGSSIVHYPREFDLEMASDLVSITNRIQQNLQTAGIAPEIEGPLMKRTNRAALRGQDDAEYRAMDAGVDRVLAAGMAAGVGTETYDEELS